MDPVVKETIEQLYKIRFVDKYDTFKQLIPGIEDTPEQEKEIIVKLVEDCCTALINLYSLRKKPAVPAVRSALLKHMDMISYAQVSTENRDFGYELCWYIAEKTGVTIRKYTETKVYGYWKVEGTRLKPVTKRGIINKKKKK